MQLENNSLSESDKFRIIILNCIGSKIYQRQNYNSFKVCIRDFEPVKLIKLLNKLHLLPLFINKIKDYSASHNYNFEPIIYYDKLRNKIVSDELKLLRKHLPGTIKPTILKGCGLWGSIYKSKQLRPVGDLDLLVEQNKLNQVSKSIIEIGYKNKSSNYLDGIHDNNFYELPPFYKTIIPGISKKGKATLDFVHDLIAPKRLIKLEENNFGFLSEIEIHKLIFKFMNGKHDPEIQNNNIIPAGWIPGYNVLSNATMLPYLAIKFISDASEYFKGIKENSISIKLAADFIRILQKCKNSEIQESISIALKWDILPYYSVMLNSVKELVPEISFEGLLKTEENILTKFIDSFLSDEKRIFAS